MPIAEFEAKRELVATAKKAERQAAKVSPGFVASMKQISGPTSPTIGVARMPTKSTHSNDNDDADDDSSDGLNDLDQQTQLIIHDKIITKRADRRQQQRICCVRQSDLDCHACLFVYC